MRFFLSIVTVCSVSTCLAQDKHDFSVEFNVNRTNYNMKNVDGYLADTIAFPPFYFGNGSYDKIRTGFDYGLTMNYQLLNFLDLGVMLAYQESEVSRLYNQSYTDPYDPSLSYSYDGRTDFKTSAVTVGLSTNVYLNKLLHLDTKDSKFLQRLQWAIGVQGGVAFNAFDFSNGLYPQINLINYPNRLTYHFTAKNIHGKVEMKLGFKFVDKTLFSCVGLKVGYQLLNTATGKDGFGVPLKYGDDQTVKMNFSGLYYGVYLKIGK